MARVNKIQRGKAIAALKKAGMSNAHAETYLKMLDLGEPLKPQIEELAEEMPDLFGLDDDGEPEEDDADEDDTPMTAREAQIARLRGRHPLTPPRPTGTTAAERNAAALGALRERSARPSTAPATAQKAAERLRAGIGSSADR